MWMLNIAGFKSMVLWYVTLCGLVNLYQRFGGTCYIRLHFRSISSRRLSALKMAAVDSFETLVPTCQTVQCHFPVYYYIDTAGRPQDVMLRFNLNYERFCEVYGLQL